MIVPWFELQRLRAVQTRPTYILRPPRGNRAIQRAAAKARNVRQHKRAKR